MKYLEQRVEELEECVKELSKELKILKALNKLNDTSRYLNNYPRKPDPRSEPYNPGVKQKPIIEPTPSDYPPYPNIQGSWDWDEKPYYVNYPAEEFTYENSSDSPTYYPPADPEDVIGYEARMSCLKRPVLARKKAPKSEKNA